MLPNWLNWLKRLTSFRDEDELDEYESFDDSTEYDEEDEDDTGFDLYASDAPVMETGHNEVQPETEAEPTEDFTALLAKNGSSLLLPDEVRDYCAHGCRRVRDISALVRCHIIENTEELPAFPTVASRVLQMVKEREAETSELEELIGADGSITANVMKYANSALFSRGVEIDVLRTAIVRIGRDEVANIAVAAALRANMLQAQTRRFNAIWSQLWFHSLTTATAARWLSGRKDRAKANQAFLCGLTHDIGKVAALNALANLINTGEMDNEVSDVEIQLILEDAHVWIGKRILEHWELPDYVVEVVGHHHDLEIDQELPSADLIHLVQCVDGLDDARRHIILDSRIESQVSNSTKALGLATETHHDIFSHLEMFGAQSEAT